MSLKERAILKSDEILQAHRADGVHQGEYLRPDGIDQLTTDLNKLIQELNAEIPNTSQASSEKTKIIARVKVLHALFQKHQDAIQTEARAHTAELYRLYLSRIATTLSVGLALLFVYWLGDCLGIPLPFRFMPMPQ